MVRAAYISTVLPDPDFPEVIAGVVLTAGRSSRMGSPKALLTHSGTTFLALLVDAMRRAGCEPVIVVIAADGEDSERIAQHAREMGAIVEFNPDPRSEQIDSLRLALATLVGRAEAVVVSPVDSPGATPEVIEALVGAIERGAPIAVPVHDGRRGHPVVFGASVLQELMSPDLPEGARTVIRRHGAEVAEMELDQPVVLWDIDTPGDYERMGKTTG